MFELWIHPEKFQSRNQKFESIFVGKFVALLDAKEYGHHIWTRRPYTWEIRKNGKTVEIQK